MNNNYKQSAEALHDTLYRATLGNRYYDATGASAFSALELPRCYRYDASTYDANGNEVLVYRKRKAEANNETH